MGQTSSALSNPRHKQAILGKKMVRSKKNPLKNHKVMLKLNPYANEAKHEKQLIASDEKNTTKEEASARKSASKEWYKTMISDSDYTECGVFSKWLGVSQ